MEECAYSRVAEGGGIAGGTQTEVNNLQLRSSSSGIAGLTQPAGESTGHCSVSGMPHALARHHVLYTISLILCKPSSLVHSESLEYSEQRSILISDFKSISDDLDFN